MAWVEAERRSTSILAWGVVSRLSSVKVSSGGGTFNQPSVRYRVRFYRGQHRQDVLLAGAAAVWFSTGEPAKSPGRLKIARKMRIYG
jgi:hypothetical protein